MDTYSKLYGDVAKLVKANDWKSFNIGSIPIITTKLYVVCTPIGRGTSLWMMYVWVRVPSYHQTIRKSQPKLVSAWSWKSDVIGDELVCGFETSVLRKKKLNYVIINWSFVFDNWNIILSFVSLQTKLRPILSRTYFSNCSSMWNYIWFNCLIYGCSSEVEC